MFSFFFYNLATRSGIQSTAHIKCQCKEMRNKRMCLSHLISSQISNDDDNNIYDSRPLGVVKLVRLEKKKERKFELFDYLIHVI